MNERLPYMELKQDVNIWLQKDRYMNERLPYMELKQDVNIWLQKLLNYLTSQLFDIELTS
jgi:hypothetical protein